MAVFRGWRIHFLFYFSLILIVSLLISACIAIRSQKNRSLNPPRNQIISSSAPPRARACPIASNAETLKLSVVKMEKSRQEFNVSETVSFVTVFTMYKISPRTESSNSVTVGNVSYSKEERSMAILDTLVDFIQNVAGFDAKQQCDHID